MNLTTRDSYSFRVFVAVSLLLGALFGAKMYESVCAAAWRLQHHPNPIKRVWAKTTIALLDLLEEDHCEIAALYYDYISSGLRRKEQCT